MSAETRPHGEPWRDADRLRELYIDQNLDRHEVAAELGCSKSAVDDWLTRHGITKDGSMPWHDPDRLRELYVEEELTDTEIAERFNSEQPTISGARRRFGIETRDHSDQRYSRAELIEYLQAVNAECEYRVTTEDIRPRDGPSHSTYAKRFGSWDDALEAADIDPDAPTRPTA